MASRTVADNNVEGIISTTCPSPNVKNNSPLEIGEIDLAIAKTIIVHSRGLAQGEQPNPSINPIARVPNKYGYLEILSIDE